MSDVDVERSKVKLTWNDTKTGFEYFRPSVIRVTITLAQLRGLVHSNEDELERILCDVLPPSFPLSRAMSLPWHRLKASELESESFLDSPEAWEWLKPALEEMIHAYMESSGDSITSFNELLDKDGRFQQVLVAIIIANTGVPPRGSALREFLYRSTSSYMVNLNLMMDAVTLVGGTQKMDTRWDGLPNVTLRAFSPRVGKLLIIYLALFRQALTEIMRLKTWHQRCSEAYRSRLFATYKLKTEASSGNSQPDGAWSMLDIISAWHAYSEPYLGVKLSIVDMRQLVTGVFREFFPTLLYGVKAQSTAVTSQGDHNASTTASHYGRDHEHRGDVSALDAQSFLQASRTYQALMQTAPVSPDWSQDILKSHCFNPEEKKDRALKLATMLIISELTQEGSSQVQIMAALEKMFEVLPFIYTSEVSFS